LRSSGVTSTFSSASSKSSGSVRDRGVPFSPGAPRAPAGRPAGPEAHRAGLDRARPAPGRLLHKADRRGLAPSAPRRGSTAAVPLLSQRHAIADGAPGAALRRTARGIAGPTRRTSRFALPAAPRHIRDGSSMTVLSLQSAVAPPLGSVRVPDSDAGFQVTRRETADCGYLAELASPGSPDLAA
jgi:hypothetical protein